MKPHRLVFTALIILTVLGRAVFAQDAKNMTILGNFGKGEGESKAVYCPGSSLVYYGLGNKLQIASFSNPASPVKVGTVILSAVVEAVVRTSIGGTQYCVVTGGSKMWIVNVQAPTNPSITATVEVTTGTTCEGVATSGSYAYVAAGGAGLKIYNIASPSAPTFVASIDSLQYCESVVISGQYAYVAAAGRSHIVDVSNPATPVYAGRIAGFGGGYHQYLNVRSGYAYICNYDRGLEVVNVTNPASPVNVTQIPSGYRTASIVFDGNYAYVAVGDSGLKIYNVVTPAAPAFVSGIMTYGRAAFLSFGTITIGSTPTGHIFISNRGAATSGISAVNVSVPASPTTSSFLGALPAATGEAFSSFYVNGKLYVAYGLVGLRILDVSTPSLPTLLSTLALAGESRGVVVKGNTAYVAAMDGGVHVVDVTNAANPVKLSTIATSRARGIALNGNQIYVASRDSGLVVLNVTTPASPVWLTNVRGIDVENVAAGGTAVGTSFYSSIRFYDVTDPSTPVAKGSTPTFRIGNEGFAIAGTYAYVPDGDSLKIFNISNLTSPSLTSKIKTGGYGYTATVVGNYCYVASEGTGVRAINISNPAVPVEDGYFDDVPLSRGVSAFGEFVYVAQKADGVSVYRNDLLTSVGDEGTLPGAFSLEQNYPNPFNPSTDVGFRIAHFGFVKLAVYDLLGREVRVLVNESKAQGSYTVRFDASGLPSGMYVYRLRANGFSAARTMMLVK